MLHLLIFSLLIPFFLFSVSLEEKVGELLIVHFNGKEANEDARKLIQEAHVGGFIYYKWANGLESPEQVRRLSASLQALAKKPLLLCVDQEGGRVNRLNQGFTQFPSNKVVAESSPEDAKRMAFTIGKELKSVGINLNLAPVVDIAVQPFPVIGERSFGSDPHKVTEYGKKSLEGYAEAGVLACLKHYPGFGSVQIDPHADLPILHKNLEALEKLELIPFKSLAKEAPLIMTTHILIPEVDPLHCVTTSKIFLEDILRKKIGFEGIIAADSLVMKALIDHCGTVNQAAVEALNGGCDLLILGGKQLLFTQSGFELTPKDVLEIHQHIIQSVKLGKIPKTRIDEAYERVSQIKTKIVRN